MVKKILLFTGCFVLSMIAFTTYAFAYFDPSTMTYLIQIVVGVVVACGAAFTFYWHKLKRSLSKKDEVNDSAESVPDPEYEMEYADEDDDLIDPIKNMKSKNDAPAE